MASKAQVRRPPADLLWRCPPARRSRSTALPTIGFVTTPRRALPNTARRTACSNCRQPTVLAISSASSNSTTRARYGAASRCGPSSTSSNAEAAEKDLLMVVFAHSWKHSAATGDRNIETFRKVLARRSEDELHIGCKTGLPARRVVGVYPGWRGEAVNIPYLDKLTFWDRKSTAQVVGHGGGTEVRSRMELVKRDKDSTVPGGSGTRRAVIGHSFGGAAVYTSLAQILQSRFVRTTGPSGQQSNIEGFGNLVVLINPAIEASLFTPLSDMSTERGTYFASQLPVMAILTSEADYATRYAFPAGRFFSTLL